MNLTGDKNHIKKHQNNKQYKSEKAPKYIIQKHIKLTKHVNNKYKDNAKNSAKIKWIKISKHWRDKINSGGYRTAPSTLNRTAPSTRVFN